MRERSVGLASVSVLFGIVATWRVNHAETQAVHAALQSRVELARDEVAADGSIIQDAGSPKTDLVQVIGPDGTIRASSAALTDAPALIDVSTVQSSSAGVERRVALQRPDIDLAVLAVPLTLPAEAGSPAGTGALVVAVDAEGFNTATDQLLGLLIAGLMDPHRSGSPQCHPHHRERGDGQTPRPRLRASGPPP